MDLSFFSEDCKFVVEDFDRYEKWINSTAISEKMVPETINIIFCSDNYILKINNEYLQHDYFTDIITFDYSESLNDVKHISGDLFISIDTVHSNSDTYGVKFREELDRVIIHGILHLIGYNDKNVEQQKEMRSKEDYYLEKREAK